MGSCWFYRQKLRKKLVSVECPALVCVSWSAPEQMKPISPPLFSTTTTCLAKRQTTAAEGGWTLAGLQLPM